MSESYILPSEFVMLIAFWFGPPCALAFWAQLRFFAPRPSVGRLARMLVFAGTPLASVALCLVTLVASPSYLRVLGVVDVHFFGRTTPFLPLAYVSVVFVGFVATVAASRHAQA